MTEVMAETGDRQALNVSLINAEFWLLLLQKCDALQGQIRCSDTVLVSLVVCLWKDIAVGAELGQILQSLKLPGSNDVDQVCWQPHVSMSNVIVSE